MTQILRLILFKALAHPTRVEMIRILADSPGLNCGQMVSRMEYAQSTISQHLQALVESGLVERTKRRTKSVYSINPEVLRAQSQEILLLLKELLGKVSE